MLIRVTGLLCLSLLASSSERTYTPVTSPDILHAGLESNLEFVRQWLKDGDFKSAVQSAQSLDALAHLYAHQSSDAQWRAQTKRLRALTARLLDFCLRKDKAKANEARVALTKELKSLRNATLKKREGVKDYRPRGSTKTWMLLMDGAYSDGKFAEDGKDMARYVREVAEEANALRFLRGGEDWNKLATGVRDVALEVATKIESKSSKEAKPVLKKIYQRCKACHDHYRR